MIRNIIFDWSGTLVNDISLVLEASNYALNKLGKPVLSLEEFRQKFCLPVQKFCEKLIVAKEFELFQSFFLESFISIQDKVEPLKYSKEFLDVVKNLHINTFLISSIPQQHYEYISLKKIPFSHYLDVVYTGVTDKKQVTSELIKKYQLKPQETLFIGDMIHDIEAAQYSGVHSCAVLTGYTQRIDLELARPELIIHDLSVLHMAMKYSLEWDAILNRIKKNQ